MSQITIHTVTEINTPAAEAWKVFGEGFGQWADWAPGIDKSTLEGPLAQGVIRVNETPSLGTVRQLLSRFDRDARALTYEVDTTLPPMFTKLRNDWLIEADGEGKCRLVGDAVFVLAEQAEPMREKLQGKMGMVLEVFANAFRDHMRAS